MICSKLCLQLGGLIGLATMKRCDSDVGLLLLTSYIHPGKQKKILGPETETGKKLEIHIGNHHLLGGSSLQPLILGCVVHDLAKLDSFRTDDTRNREFCWIELVKFRDTLKIDCFHPNMNHFQENGK